MSDTTTEQEQDLGHPNTPAEYGRIYLSGFAMGSADIVPGVSGGTMAFILGIYETLINAIKSFNLDAARIALQFDFKALFEHIPIRFLMTLGLGLGTAVLLLANILHTLLEEQPTFLFAFFGGLIIASIIAIGVKVTWSPGAIAALLAAAVFAFVLVGLDSNENNRVEALIEAVETSAGIDAAQATLIEGLTAEDYTPEAFDSIEAQVAALITAVENGDDVEPIQDEMESALYEASDPVTLFFSGMIAICAMILPGISGSFILLILGQYGAVLGAVKNFDIVSIGVIGAGAAIGIVIFSRVISWLLKHYENVTVAALVGFMAGSMRLIWTEAANGVEVINDTTTLAGDQIALVILLVAIGFLLVSFLDHLQSRSNPVFAWAWKGQPPVDTISEKAEALD